MQRLGERAQQYEDCGFGLVRGTGQLGATGLEDSVHHLALLQLR